MVSLEYSFVPVDMNHLDKQIGNSEFEAGFLLLLPAADNVVMWPANRQHVSISDRSVPLGDTSPKLHRGFLRNIAILCHVISI